MGTITEGINKEDNSITWTIPELKSGETAIVQYKLKLKENYSDDILDKVLDTHTNLNLDYTDFYGNTDTKSSDITPKVKLTEPAPVPEPAPTILPDAGLSNITIIEIIGSLILVYIVTGIKYIIIKK